MATFLGTLFIASDGAPVNGEVGELWVDYDVTLYLAKMYTVPNSLPFYSAYYLADGTNMVPTPSLLYSDRGNIAVTFPSPYRIEIPFINQNIKGWCISFIFGADTYIAGSYLVGAVAYVNCDRQGLGGYERYYAVKKALDEDLSYTLMLKIDDVTQGCGVLFTAWNIRRSDANITITPCYGDMSDF